jgi:hypothetical protein
MGQFSVGAKHILGHVVIEALVSEPANRYSPASQRCPPVPLAEAEISDLALALRNSAAFRMAVHDAYQSALMRRKSI